MIDEVKKILKIRVHEKSVKNYFKKQVRRGTYRESENLLRSIDIW